MENNFEMSVEELVGSVDYNNFNKSNLMCMCDYFYNYADYNNDIPFVVGIKLTETFRHTLTNISWFLKEMQDYGGISKRELYNKLKETSDTKHYKYLLSHMLDFKTFCKFLDSALLVYAYDFYAHKDKEILC